MQNVKVTYMKSNTGREVPKQFIIEIEDWGRGNVNPDYIQYFNSYSSIIAVKSYEGIQLDEYYWNHSRTTSKYRSQFLGESTEETQAKIDSGEYKLVNLN